MHAGQNPPSLPVRPVEWAWLLGLGLLTALWCVTSAAQLSATFDEPIYLREGLQRWRTGSTAGLMRYGTMPLPVDVQTLPLYVWERLRGEPFDLTADFHALLPWARAMTLVFWWLLLFHVWLAARSLGGPWAGIVAVSFVAVEPSLLAHASLATTDIAVTACMVALVYHFQRHRESPSWWKRIAWPAFWFGLAVLAKASGLVFGALCLLAVEGLRCGWWRRSRADALLGVSRNTEQKPTFRASFRQLFQIGFLGMVFVFVWCGSDFKPQRSFLAWANGLPEGSNRTVMVWAAEHLRIFSNAGEGLIKQVTHNVRGHGAYLLGHSDPRALWYYFPVLLTIKLTVPLLLAVLFFGLLRLRARSWDGNWALLCAAVLLAFSVLCRVQIGVRFMFPLICFAIIGLSALLVQVWQEASSLHRRRFLTAATVGCLLWTVGSTAAVWPHGLCYVNPLWGGTREGYRVVSDANYDWGQGVKELDRWHHEHGLVPLDAWHFCADPLVERLPLRPVHLHHEPIASEADFLARVRGHHLAVSTTLLHGAIAGPGMPVIRDALASRKPAARTMTFLIYDFTNEAAP